MSDKYTYFVAYNFQKELFHGTANISMTLDHKINSFETLNALSDSLKENFSYKSVVIINFILMSQDQ